MLDICGSDAGDALYRYEDDDLSRSYPAARLSAQSPYVNVFKHVGMDKGRNCHKDGDVSELIVSEIEGRVAGVL